MLDIGSIIDGKYKVLNVVGKGGMSVVYQVVNERANKIWAIKEVRKDGVSDFEVVRQNLVAETDMLKKLNHPNLPNIVDVIDMEGTFLIVMDYVEGRPLSDILKINGAQPEKDVIEWAKQLCDVLGYLHSRRPPIIYRDMKPSNVMLKPDGSVILIDFGTAREFKTAGIADTTCLGTRGYAAPEQFGGQGQTDARTDIYCLGATMYHLVTGHNPALPPYEMYPIRQWNPTLSSGLEEIILKCTQLNPNDRYQNCAELMYALDNVEYLNIENKKVQNVKWRIFCASLVMTFIGGAGTIGFRIAADAAMADTYDSCITTAQSAQTLDERIENCQQAIKLNPQNPYAYELLLSSYINNGSDDRFMDTDTKFTCVANDSEYGQYLSIVKPYVLDKSNDYSNEDFGDKVYMKVGEALFFSSDSDMQGKNVSKQWLEKAEQYGSTKIKKKAKAMLKFRDNYDKLLKPVLDNNGELSEINYVEYWESIKEMEQLAVDEFESSNGRDILLTIDCFKMCTLEISSPNRLDMFRSYGITNDEIEKLIADITSYTNEIETKINANVTANEAETVNTEIRGIRTNINNIRKEINK